MLDANRISAKHYYDYLPSPAHRCGDIWGHLPTFGLIKSPLVSGIVVTPACDLSNNKTETITFLPVLSIRAYFATTAVLPLLKSKIVNLLQAGHLDLQIDWPNHEFRPPPLPVIEAALSAIQAHLTAKQRGASEVSSLRKVQCGLRVVAGIVTEDHIEADIQNLAATFGSEWDKLLRRILTNSFSSEIHFLPFDEQNASYSGVTRHSVVLFRYPITVPIEILDLAQDASHATWAQVVSRQQLNLPAIQFYQEALPMKLLSLSPRFLADLLSRYVSVYNRIGSPDFSQLSVTRMVSEV